MGSAALATVEPHERGVLFTGPNVLKILAGTKGQTRRIISCIPDHTAVREIAKVGYRVSDGRPDWIVRGIDGAALPVIPSGKQSVRAELHCPYGKVGDRLWVRETFSLLWPDDCEDGLIYDDAHPDGRPITDRECEIAYRASGDAPAYDEKKDAEVWRPSIHMPRWASRLTLEITDVRVERLQDISEEDAIAEGVGCPAEPIGLRVRAAAFAASWDALHGAGAWDANPWVWAITFRVVNRG